MISPLLANIYLHWFEKAFYGPQGPATWAQATLVRYADDFVILARDQARRDDWVETQLEGRFADHQSVEDAHGRSQATVSVSFLGFTFRYDRDLNGRDQRDLNVFPSDKSFARLREKLRLFRGLPGRHLFRGSAGGSLGGCGAGNNTSRMAIRDGLSGRERVCSSRGDSPPATSESTSLPASGGKSYTGPLQCLGLQLL